VATLHYLMKCRNVTIYGFNFMIDNQPHHYCDNIKKGNYHEPWKEWVFFNNCLTDKKINFLGWDRKNQSMPIIRMPEKCGSGSIEKYRESTQLGWYNWIARECINRSVLDVGCGLGNGKKLLEQAPGSNVVGVDEDPELSGVVSNYVCGIDNVKRAFDIVVCIDAIEHVVDDLSFFRKMYDLFSKKLFITTPNFSRSMARNHAHCREYTISQFMNILKPDELWVASPDGWFNLQCIVSKKGNAVYPLDKTWNNNSPDGLEWAHMCGVWNK
jgi:2-polyprenyl-3-methyl-5-hydroxy-6-metoxy-1,4-benzoquinol methylase